MARNAAVVFAFRESPRDITSCRASKKTRTQIAMAVPTKISLSALLTYNRKPLGSASRINVRPLVVRCWRLRRRFC
jgi:hypothetical protein